MKDLVLDLSMGHSNDDFGFTKCNVECHKTFNSPLSNTNWFLNKIIKVGSKDWYQKIKSHEFELQECNVGKDCWVMTLPLLIKKDGSPYDTS